MANKRKQKRRLKKAIANRREELLKTWWRNIFVEKGILQRK
jgi:hypothetical protein